MTIDRRAPLKKGWLGRVLRPHSMMAFVQKLPQRAILLDVGCGNDSPARVKSLRSDIYYIGIDVSDYNQTIGKSFADEYFISPPSEFVTAIHNLGVGRFDAVISSHNLEHCNDPDGVLVAMSTALKVGGQMFAAFPSQASVHFPTRRGTLNFYDDPTHKEVPNWNHVLNTLKANGCVPTFAVARYRPLLFLLMGLICEPLMAYKRKLAPKKATWALYGFESIIWAEKQAEQ